MKKFKLWILNITIALWKRKLYNLGLQADRANAKLVVVKEMYKQIEEEE